MKLTITIKQGRKKVRTIETKLSDSTQLTTLKTLVAAEQDLNNLPGSDLRWHFEVSE